MPAAQDKVQQFDFYKYLRIFWRRKWLLIIPLVISTPVAIVAAWHYPTEYSSKAILELTANMPKVEGRGRLPDVVGEISTVRQRMFGWSAIRDIVLSRKVDFGREIDPDDRRQLERVYNEILRRTHLATLGGRHIQVSHRSISPERNAALVNELIKKYVGEDRREAQDQAKIDVEYYREKLNAAKAAMTDVDNQMRDFTQNNPWLRDDLAELHRDLKDAEAEEAAIRQEIAELEANRAEIKKALAKEPPEITETHPVEVSEEVKATRAAAQSAERYFGEINRRYTPVHRLWRDAKRRLDEAAARLKEIDTGEEMTEETRDNPRYAELQGAFVKVEKLLEKLNARKLEANKKVSELFLLSRKAPELLAEKKRLEEQRAGITEQTSELGKFFRGADKELQRLMTEAYSSRFKVLEYARDDRTPVKSTKLKIIVLGFLMGLLTGAGLIVLVEYLDQTFKTIDDARESLGIPALGVIPAIFTPADHRRRLWFRVLAVSSAVFVVGVAVTLYLAVPAVPRFVKGELWPGFQELIQGF